MTYATVESSVLREMIERTLFSVCNDETRYSDSLPHNIAEFKTARVLAVGKTRAEAQERARPQLESFCEWGCHFTGPIRGPRFGYRPWLIP